jgi:hypothetical protein
MSRVNPFENLDDFAPKKKPAQVKPDEKAMIDRIAEDNNFPSRQPARKADVVPSLGQRTQRRYKTGRNQQINIKATDATIQRFYRLADAENVPLGEILDRALDALEKQGSLAIKK